MEHHTLTNELFNDLLDPRIPMLDVCRAHAITVNQLSRILASPEFQDAADALDLAEQLRARALAPDRRERALATLDAIASQQPTTPSHTECIRRAASALLRATKEARTPNRTPPTDTHNPHTHDPDTHEPETHEPETHEPATPNHAPPASAPTHPSTPTAHTEPFADAEPFNHTPSNTPAQCSSHPEPHPTHLPQPAP